MKFFFVFCVLCGFASAAWALDREAFTIAKYDLEIRLEPQQQRLGARGKITLRNDSARPQKIVALQISSSLNWRSIRVDGKAVQLVSQPYVSDIDHTGALSEAIVTLPVEIKPKDSVEIEIGYEGVIPLDTTRLTRVGIPEGIAKHTSWDQISPSFTAVRGAGYVAWYPIATESADFSEGNSLFEVVDRWKSREAWSTMIVNFCSPDGFAPAEAVLMGDFVSGVRGSSMGGIAEHGGATISCIAHRFEPIGAQAPTFALANFKKESPEDFSVTIYSLAGHEEGGATYSNALEPATKFVSGWFGPSSAPIAIADLADPNSAPFESGTLLMASMAAEDSKLAGINLVHELVHSSLPSSRPWVYEGLAHFAEAMYRQEQGGRQAALDFLGLHRAAFLDSEKEVSAAPDKKVGQPLAVTFDETYYRSKAAYVWWMLRDMAGDDALKEAIRKYRAEDDNDKAPKYVEQLIEAAAKRDLGWFFDDWVYQDRGLPDFHVQSVHPWKTEKGVQFITVTLENLGNAGAEVPFTVIFEGGEITKRIEVRAKATATTRVELPGTASRIVVNDGSVPESDLTNNVFKISAP